MPLPAGGQRDLLAAANRSRRLVQPSGLLQLIIVPECSDELVQSLHVLVNGEEVVVDLLDNFRILIKPRANFEDALRLV